MNSNERLIHAVHSRRDLWDPNSVNHRNKLITNRLWKEIADEIESDCDSSILKVKWKSLRDYYRAEYKKCAIARKNGDDSVQPPAWPHFHHMSFLNDSIKFRTPFPNSTVEEETYDSIEFTENSIKTEAESDDLENDDAEFPFEVCTLEANPQIKGEQIEESPVGKQVKSVQARQGRGVKRIAADLAEYKHEPNVGNYEDETDEDLLFFKSILPDLKVLPRSRKVFVKWKLQELLMNEITALENK